jgi:hypothetical protein
MPQFQVAPKSLLDFLRSMDTRLVIPDYQRGYSWEKTQIDELLLDLGQVDSNEYLVGSMIFINRDSEPLEVVDGQQRLTTFYILLSALHEALKKYTENNERAENEKDRLKGALYDIDNAGSRVYKLELGGFDKNYFRELICENRTIEPNKAFTSNKLIFDAHRVINEYVSKIDETEGLAGLLTEIERIKKITLITIYVGNEGDAYTIFEAINDRGASLTVADLLKNFLLKIAHTKNDEPERVKENWETVITTLGELKVTDLLTYFWRAKRENVTTSRLFKAIKTHLEEASYSPKLFADELVLAAESYRKIEYPEEFGLHPSIQDLLSGIRATGFKQWYPLMIAALMKGTERDKLVKLLKAIEGLSVHLKVAGFNPSELEAKYVNWANRMLTDGPTQVDHIVQEINNQYPSLENFKLNFIERAFDVNLAKLILIRAEQTRGEGDNNLDFDSYELEHIMPKRLNEDWSHISSEVHSEFLNDIGNLTLLAKEQNIRGSNKKFLEKKSEYSNSRIRITNELAGYSEDLWGPEQIKARGEQLLAIIASVYPYPSTQ